MRLIQISVPQHQQEAILDVLQKYQVGYTLTSGVGEQDEQIQINFVTPADAVEHILTDLAEVGFDRETYLVSTDVEFASFEEIDTVQNQWGKSPNRLAPAALRSKAKDIGRNITAYLWMMILSAIVATAGLFIGSPAVVVGSMVIAPIVSPVLTTIVGIVRNDREMVLSSIHMQALGLGVAVTTATVSAWILRQLGIVPVTLAVEQLELVSVRLSPSILAFAVSLCAGAAGAYGLATKGNITIVGVMIAAALIPTAAAAGIGIAWQRPLVVIGSVLLLLLSVIGVNIGGTVMLLYLDYRPDNVDEGIFTFDDAYTGFVVVATIGVTIVTIGALGGLFYQYTVFERSVNEATTDVIDNEQYSGLAIRSISIQYNPPVLSKEPSVTVSIARTTDEAYPRLPEEVRREITERTGEDVVVLIRYVDFERSDTTKTHDPESEKSLRLILADAG